MLRSVLNLFSVKVSMKLFQSYGQYEIISMAVSVKLFQCERQHGIISMSHLLPPSNVRFKMLYVFPPDFLAVDPELCVSLHSALLDVSISLRAG